MLSLFSVVLSLILFGCGSEATPLASDEQATHAPAELPSKASLLLVEMNEGFVSIQARNVPLQAILDKITPLAEIEFVLETPLVEAVSLRFVDLPVDEAIRRLLGAGNHLFIYGPDDGRLQKVLVISG